MYLLHENILRFFFLFDFSILFAAARLDRLADAEVVTVSFNVLHDPTSTTPSKAHSYAPSSSSSSPAAAAVTNSSPSSSSTSSTTVGKIPPPILNTASYLNKMKQRAPTEGKGWWVNNEEKQGEGEGKEKEKEVVENSEAKQGMKASEDFSYGVKNVSKGNGNENENERERGGGGGVVKESQPRILNPGDG